MKTAKPKDYYIHRAASDFRDLVEYFTCIRPRHQKAFQDENGEFEPKKLNYALDFVSDFKHQPKSYKAKNAKRYRFFQKVINDTFCIPTFLIEKVLGKWTDENGNRHHVTLAEITPLVSSFCERWTNHGHTFTKKGGKPSQTFCNKWRICNDKQWHTLLSIDRDIFHESLRVANIIRDFVKKERKNAETKDFSTANTKTKNEDNTNKTNEMTNIPHEDPPWVTNATAQKTTVPQAISKPQKEETRIKAASAAPDPARKARLISRIEDLANTGKITRSNYVAFMQFCYGEAPKPGVGKNIEESSNSLGTMYVMYKTVFFGWKPFCVPFRNRDLIEFQTDKYYFRYVESLRKEGFLQRKVA